VDVAAQNGYSEDDLRLTDLIDSTDFGESIRHVSALVATEEYFRSNETSECDFKMVGGNSRLCQELARRIGMNSIHLKTPVQEVNQRGSQVYVRSGERRWNADACICTVPTRTLNKIQFDPPLPAAQSLAADQLQYARI
jgi:monoamine oxidase